MVEILQLNLLAFAESIQELLMAYVELYFTEIEVGAIVYLFR